MNTAQRAPQIFLWPMPKRLEYLGGTKRWPKYTNPAWCSCPIDFDRIVHRYTIDFNRSLQGIQRDFKKTTDTEPAFGIPANEDQNREIYKWNRELASIRQLNCSNRRIGHPSPPGTFMTIEFDENMVEGAFRLEIRGGGVGIYSVSHTGIRYALNLILQLIAQYGRNLPCVLIEDHPDFATRGFMLDISRCKVASGEALDELLAILSHLRFNQLQLYMEHTFAFSKHKQVWGDSSPLTATDLRQLEERCAYYGIELTANFNSFGHFERWLKHPEYKHLAECPDGFEHPIKGKVPHGTTLRPNAASLKFLDKLWAEYLPLFKSKRFNLGGDEPWELGQGWSKPLVKKYGKHRVYLDFLKKLHALAKKHGKEMLFWGDILLESPELVKEVPQDATALLWGYEADHPFAEQCAKLAKAKRKFWVCPGTSAWNTFTGRSDNMLANVESAAKHGLANGAEGLLLTSWGDGGNHQPWPVMYPGLVYAAGMAWNAKGTKRADLPRAIDVILGEGKKPSGLGRILLEAGQIENGIKQAKPNRSRQHALFFATRSELKRELKTLSGAELRATAKAIEQARQKLRTGNYWCGEEMDSAAEAAFGLEMAAWAVKRAKWTLAGKNLHPLAGELRALIGNFEEHWIVRARSGGLHEASARMRAVEKEL
jgi:hypothetical protein